MKKKSFFYHLFLLCFFSIYEVHFSFSQSQIDSDETASYLQNIIDSHSDLQKLVYIIDQKESEILDLLLKPEHLTKLSEIYLLYSYVAKELQVQGANFNEVKSFGELPVSVTYNIISEDHKKTVQMETILKDGDKKANGESIFLPGYLTSDHKRNHLLQLKSSLNKITPKRMVHFAHSIKNKLKIKTIERQLKNLTKRININSFIHKSTNLKTLIRHIEKAKGELLNLIVKNDHLNALSDLHSLYRELGNQLQIHGASYDDVKDLEKVPFAFDYKVLENFQDQGNHLYTTFKEKPGLSDTKLFHSGYRNEGNLERITPFPIYNEIDNLDIYSDHEKRNQSDFVKTKDGRETGIFWWLAKD